MTNAFLNLMAAVLFVFHTGAAHAGVLATDHTYGVFGSSSGQRFLDVATHGKITDLDILVSFAKCNDPAIGPAGGACRNSGNPYENEIFMHLTSPTGITVELIAANTFARGGSGLGQVDVTFDDDGAVLGPHVAAGSFRPVGDLSLFEGLDVFGRWTLVIGDGNGGDPLEYYHSQLIVSTEAGSVSISEPASLGLLGLGLLGLVAVRGRSKW